MRNVATRFGWCWVLLMELGACASAPPKASKPGETSSLAAPIVTERLPIELGEDPGERPNPTEEGGIAKGSPEFRKRVFVSSSARIEVLPFAEAPAAAPGGTGPQNAGPRGLAGTSASLAEKEGMGADTRGTAADRGGLAVGLAGGAIPKREYVECIVVGAGAVPRVLVDLPSQLRILLYVDPSELAWTVSEPTWLPSKPSEEATREGAGPTVFPGLVLEVLEETQQWRHVAWDDGLLRAEGWLPAASLKHEFTPVLVADAVPVTYDLAPGTLLFDRPKGTVVAQVGPRAPLPAERLEPPRGGHVKVRVQVESLSSAGERRIQYQVVGYVPEAALGARAGQVGTSSSGPSLGGSSERFTVPRGTRFYDRPDGNVVGVALGAVSVGEGASLGGSRGSVVGGFRAVVADTPWSAIQLWIRK